MTNAVCALPVGSVITAGRRYVMGRTAALRDAVRDAPLPLPVAVIAASLLTFVLHVAGHEPSATDDYFR